MPGDRALEDFLTLSAVLTGYDRASLHGTGCVEDYWRQVRKVVPEHCLGCLLTLADRLSRDYGTNPEGLHKAFRRQIMASEDYGPVARAVTKLWYLGIWYPMPERWRERHGSSPFDVMQVISSRAYKEGLVWDAMGAHPMGAKQQGFGAWAQDPPPEPEI